MNELAALEEVMALTDDMLERGRTALRRLSALGMGEEITALNKALTNIELAARGVASRNVRQVRKAAIGE